MHSVTAIYFMASRDMPALTAAAQQCQLKLEEVLARRAQPSHVSSFPPYAAAATVGGFSRQPPSLTLAVPTMHGSRPFDVTELVPLGLAGQGTPRTGPGNLPSPAGGTAGAAGVPLHHQQLAHPHLTSAALGPYVQSPRSPAVAALSVVPWNPEYPHGSAAGSPYTAVVSPTAAAAAGFEPLAAASQAIDQLHNLETALASEREATAKMKAALVDMTRKLTAGVQPNGSPAAAAAENGMPASETVLVTAAVNQSWSKTAPAAPTAPSAAGASLAYQPAAAAAASYRASASATTSPGPVYEARRGSDVEDSSLASIAPSAVTPQHDPSIATASTAIVSPPSDATLSYRQALLDEEAIRADERRRNLAVLQQQVGAMKQHSLLESLAAMQDFLTAHEDAIRM